MRSLNDYIFLILLIRLVSRVEDRTSQVRLTIFEKCFRIKSCLLSEIGTVTYTLKLLRTRKIIFLRHVA